VKERFSERIQRLNRPDYKLVVIAAILLSIGMTTVYSISPSIAARRGIGQGALVLRQFISVSLGLIAFTFTTRIKLDWWKHVSWLLIAGSVGSSLLLLAVGENINGATRWITFGGFSFQVAELIKLSILVAFATYLAKMQQAEKLNSVNVYKVISAIILFVLVFVVNLQSDLGSGAVMLAMVGTMSLISGVKLYKLLPIALLVGVALFGLIVTSAYRRERIRTYLSPTKDCQKEGYQICEALKAVGSGGIGGKGLTRGVQAYGYLPEAENDSIFAIIAEKFGFLGTSLVLGLYGYLYYRLRRIAINMKSLYHRLLASGVLTWIGVQALINIMAIIGLIPLKGITLPFISYGGTSLLFTAVGLGIVFQCSRYIGVREK
jgi:cell division protein FtsW